MWSGAILLPLSFGAILLPLSFGAILLPPSWTRVVFVNLLVNPGLAE
jgi:hypothetical protein